jgi:predicted esterase
MKPGLVESGPRRMQAQRAAVLLHGRGGGPEDMMALAARLALADWRWVAPGVRGDSWYPHRFLEPVELNQPYLSNAVAECERAIDDASDHGRLGAERLAVIGFSQGACLASEYVLRHPDRCRTLVMFTGGIIGTDVAQWREIGRRLDGLRVLITGSDADEWVPEQRVRETAQVLVDLGADVRMRIYPGRPHAIDDREIVEARAVLAVVGGGTAAAVRQPAPPGGD